MMRLVLLGSVLLGPVALVAACEPVPVTPERAAAICAERAEAARGPTTAVAIGASSEDGLEVGTAIGLSSDFLTGRDPAEVYQQCFVGRTGTAPAGPFDLYPRP